MDLSNEFYYNSTLLKWKLLSSSTKIVRSFEDSEKKLKVDAPKEIEEIDEDMKRAQYEKQSLLDLDTYPSPEYVNWRLNVAKEKIGDCQSYAVFAAARLSLLPSTEKVEVINIAAVKMLLKSGRKGGHAVCLYKRGGKFGIMQQNGRLGAFDSENDAIQHLSKLFDGKCLFWGKFNWRNLGLINTFRL